jgi:hypothetical protein
MISRRHFARGTFAFAISVGSRSARALAPNLPADLARLEAESGGRLGVAVLDSATGAVAGPGRGLSHAVAAVGRPKKCRHCLRWPPHCGSTVMLSVC